MEASNILRLKSVFIEPDGSLVVIGGENGAGKSCVLDSIMFAFGGDRTLPTKPLKEGSKKGKIKIEIDGYTIIKTFSKRGSYLTITDADGKEIKSAQTFLNGLVGRVSFDPLEFTRMSAKEQAEQLRLLTGIDTAKLDSKRADLYAERTMANRLLKETESLLGTMIHHESVGAELLSASKMVSEIDKAATFNREVLINANDKKKNNHLIERTKSAIKELKEDLKKYNDTSKVIDERVELYKETIEVQPLRDKLSEIEATNDKIRENIARRNEQEIRKVRIKESDELTTKIEAIDEKKEKMLQAVEYPLEGLGFDENGLVLWEGLPFSQASSAEQIRVSVGIGLAMNPKLPVMRIYDGSLLDTKSLAMIKEMAEKANAQIWMERVGDGAEVSIVIEDGMVRGADVEEEVEEEVEA